MNATETLRLIFFLPIVISKVQQQRYAACIIIGAGEINIFSPFVRDDHNEQYKT